MILPRGLWTTINWLKWLGKKRELKKELEIDVASVGGGNIILVVWTNIALDVGGWLGGHVKGVRWCVQYVCL